jgi:hypothetical protein
VTCREPTVYNSNNYSNSEIQESPSLTLGLFILVSVDKTSIIS